MRISDLSSDVCSSDPLVEEYEFLDADDRYRLLIDLGKAMEPMPDALKTAATLVRGCSAAVWVYPTVLEDGRLHFLADSNAAITKGIISLVRSEEPTSELQSLMRISYAVFCLNKINSTSHSALTYS